MNIYVLFKAGCMIAEERNAKEYKAEHMEVGGKCTLTRWHVKACYQSLCSSSQKWDLQTRLHTQ